MENILTQRYVYASITSYRNYSKIYEKNEKSIINNDEDYFGIFGGNKDIVKLPKKNRKKLFFFYSENEERILLKNILKSKNSHNVFHTTKDNQIKRHYGNPFSSISITIVERTIKRNGDKVTIKLYVNHRQRGVNCIYFKKNQYSHSLTVNTKTGNFTVSEISKEKKKWTKKFRINNFMSLSRLINGTALLNASKMLDKQSRLKNEFDKAFDEKIFNQLLINSLELNSTNYYNKNKNDFESDFIKKFVELKRIKVPNGNFSIYLKNFYPTEKYLKKNDRKLISSLLDMLGIKSKLTIKILHQNPNIDIFGLYCYCKIFGDNFTNYLSNINNRVFEDSYKTYDNGFDVFNKNHILYDVSNLKNLQNEYEIRENEKQNILKLLNSDSGTFKTMSQNSFSILLDHLKMIKKIRKYDDTIEFRAKTNKEFHDEHVYLSSLVSAMRKGWVIEYVYDQKTINEIEIPCEKMVNLGTKDNPSWGIDLDGKEYLYPKILKREEEYTEEGKFMHHCVSSYVERDKSMIVSIRTKDGDDRVTCEYEIQTGKLIQERYFCNGVPPKEFEYALAKVGEKVKKLARWGTLNWKEKKEVPIKINGITILPKSIDEEEETYFF